MTTALYDNPADNRTATALRLSGWALIAASVAVPQGFNAMNDGGAAMAGDALARSLGQLLIPAVIAWWVTRKSTAQKKAQAVFIVGLLMLVTSLVVSYNSSRTDAAQREYLKTALIINAEGEAKLQALGAKFDAVNMAGALTMDNFVYPDRRASAMGAAVVNLIQ